MNKLFIIISVCSVLVAVSIKRQSVHEIDNIKIEHQMQIVQIEDKYNKMIKDYRDSEQRNNIVQTVTVYKPSGEKTVTRVVNRTITVKKEEKQATETRFYRLDKNEENSVRETKREIVKSSLKDHYIVGVTSLQPLTTNLSDYSLTGGIRLFSTPIYLTASIPLSTDFYKKTAIGLSISF